MLQIDGLVKSYGPVRALGGIDLRIRPGEIMALLGPNGAGKTTLVSIVAGLLRPDAGDVRVGGVSVNDHPHVAQASIGLAPQNLGIYPTLTVADNLCFFGSLKGLSRTKVRSEIGEAAELLKLTDCLTRRAGQLSGGEQRRLHTAIALLGRSPLLLLDEATSGVDAETRQHVLATIRRLAQEGTAVCYSTHYFPEVEALAASVAILNHGQLVACGSLEKILSTHAKPAVKLTFDGPVPEIDLEENVERFDSSIVVRTENPQRVALQLLARLDHVPANVLSVEIMRPNLETVFLALTGRDASRDRNSVSSRDPCADPYKETRS